MNSAAMTDPFEGTRNSNRDGTPYLIWRHSVEMSARNIGVVGDEEFWASLGSRLSMWWNAGEPVWMAVDGVRQLARGWRVAKLEAADGRMAIASWRKR